MYDIDIDIDISYLSFIWSNFTMNVWGSNASLELYSNKCFSQDMTVEIRLFPPLRHAFGDKY